MLRSLGMPLLVIGLANLVAAAESSEDSDVKFAFYSSAWGENTDDGLRLVANNRTNRPIRLDTITFSKESGEVDEVVLNMELEVPAMGYADKEFEYIDLLSGNECIQRTLEGNWKLVEISNYTLNPSVRNLIIENTDSFRIYQCVESVITSWTDLTLNASNNRQEWVLFHFENRAEP